MPSRTERGLGEWIVLDISRHLLLPIVDAIGLVVEEEV
jgi:hypothetical protein